MTNEKDPYFVAIEGNEAMELPGSIQGGEQQQQEPFKFINPEEPNSHLLKYIGLTVFVLILMMFAWSLYDTFNELWMENLWLAGGFGMVVAVLIGLCTKQAFIFRKGQLGLKKTVWMREQAEIFIKEHTHGQSAELVRQFRVLYIGKPQGVCLEKVLKDLPDYLDDREIVARLSADFLSELDEEAKKLIIQESSVSAGLIAVSQLVVVDSVIVFWRIMKLVNGINSIYGLNLTKLGQWRLLVQISKAIMLAGVTQTGINYAADTLSKANPFFGPMAASLTQGLAVGAYVAKIGVEAMKQSRPIAFEDGETPNVNLITDGVRLLLYKTFSAEEKL